MHPLPTSKAGALPPPHPRYHIPPIKKQNITMRYLTFTILLILLLALTRGRVASVTVQEWDYIIVGTGMYACPNPSRILCTVATLYMYLIYVTSMISSFFFPSRSHFKPPITNRYCVLQDQQVPYFPPVFLPPVHVCLF
ncbi:hypothetical protein BZA77DRAFT_5918 [Pyronema omphalodes]|nr:hypothetical protein BZA77DRAFT_5918 [Pyronema omphalodes]